MPGLWFLTLWGAAWGTSWGLVRGAAAEEVRAKSPRRISFGLPPDVRPKGCEAYNLDPTGKNFSEFRASIVIPCRNEKWAHVRGSVESILLFTPKRLIEEIIFVSDGNDATTAYLEEIRSLSKLVVVVAFPPPGLGLIEAKMRAVAMASPRSNVLVFLEPHIRVNRRWLEALLLRLRRNPNALVMPSMDNIDPHSFADSYSVGSRGHWRFEWNLNLIYTDPLGADANDPRPSLQPATSGGIFAVMKDWWIRLELYDLGMFGWGGDHAEASMKVWRCGGIIESVPCSRVGHMFRQPVDRPYPVDVPTVVRNYGRIAKVWLDEYWKDFAFLKAEVRGYDLGNLTTPTQSRERLQCKSMSWYLDNVDHELKWERDHICIPGAPRLHHGCEFRAAPGRSTIDRVMPLEAYLRALKGAEEGGIGVLPVSGSEEL